MAKMRIVGLNENRRNDEPYAIFIQKYDARKSKWIQEILSENEFIEMMKTEFSDFWKEYEISGTEKSVMTYFYNYGETPEMKRKGESFIYS